MTRLLLVAAALVLLLAAAGGGFALGAAAVPCGQTRQRERRLSLWRAQSRDRSVAESGVIAARVV